MTDRLAGSRVPYAWGITPEGRTTVNTLEFAQQLREHGYGAIFRQGGEVDQHAVFLICLTLAGREDDMSLLLQEENSTILALQEFISSYGTEIKAACLGVMANLAIHNAGGDPTGLIS